MTPQESREDFLESLYSPQDIEFLKEVGLYYDYVEGHISIITIYQQFKDQGV